MKFCLWYVNNYEFNLQVSTVDGRTGLSGPRALSRVEQMVWRHATATVPTLHRNTRERIVMDLRLKTQTVPGILVVRTYNLMHWF